MMDYQLILAMLVYLGTVILVYVALYAVTKDNSVQYIIVRRQQRRTDTDEWRQLDGLGEAKEQNSIVSGLTGAAKKIVLSTISLSITLFAFLSLNSFAGTYFPRSAQLTFEGLSINIDSQFINYFRPDAYSLALAVASCLLLISFWFLRRTLVYPFAIFHLFLFMIAVLRDMFGSPVQLDSDGLISGLGTFVFYVMIVSQSIFLSFNEGSGAMLKRSLISSAFSVGSLVLGIHAMTILAQSFSGSTLVFLCYMSIAYGVFGAHIVSLSVLLSLRDSTQEA